MISLADIDYPLPTQLIAHSPLSQREQAKLLVLNRDTGEMQHQHFFDLPTLLRSGDVLVRNRSKVIPARLLAIKPTGGKVEVLLNKLLEPNSNTWECLCKPGLHPKQTLRFSPSLSGEVMTHVQDSIVHQIRFSAQIEHFITELEKIGHTPLPHYIHSVDSEAKLRQEYQTLFAKEPGSAAAPTAGLHFTPELDQQLREKGIQIEEVVLHVGLGTFAPIRHHNVEDHQIHSEWFSLSAETAERINQAMSEGRRIIAVGTTTVRVLESCAALVNTPLTHASADQNGAPNVQASTPAGQSATTTPATYHLTPQTGETSIYIYPPYQFKIVDGLITNFHLPKTSLLLLVSAFCSAPNTTHTFTTLLESTFGRAYTEAVSQNYRFFSFGDGMLVENS